MAKKIERDKLGRVVSVTKNGFDNVKSIEYVGKTLVPQKIVFSEDNYIERQESGQYVQITSYVKNDPPKIMSIRDVSVSQRRGAVYWIGPDPYKSGQDNLQFVDADDNTPDAKSQGAAAFIAVVLLLIPGIGIIGFLMIMGIVIGDTIRTVRRKRRRLMDTAWEAIAFSRSMRQGLTVQ